MDTSVAPPVVGQPMRRLLQAGDGVDVDTEVAIAGAMRMRAQAAEGRRLLMLER